MADGDSRGIRWDLEEGVVAEDEGVQRPAGQIPRYFLGSAAEAMYRFWNPPLRPGVSNSYSLAGNAGAAASGELVHAASSSREALQGDGFSESHGQLAEWGMTRTEPILAESRGLEGLSNCDGPSIGLSVDPGDFALDDEIKVENGVDGGVRSSLKRVGGRQDGAGNDASGIGTSQRFDPLRFSERLLHGMSTLDDLSTPCRIQFFPLAEWELGSEEDDMAVDGPSISVQSPEAYRSSERSTDAARGGFDCDAEIGSDQPPSSSRLAMPHITVPDKMQHKRAKVLGGSLSGHVAATAPSDISGSSYLGETELILFQNLTSKGISQMFLPLSSLPDGNGGREPMDSDNGGDGDEDQSGQNNMDDHEVRMDLTDDLLHMVFSFLDHTNLCQAARVCRQWRSASTHEDFWKYLNFENRTITIDQVSQMCQRYPKAVRLNVLGAPLMDELAREAMHSLRNLEVLILGRGPLSDGFFNGLVDCPVLEQLSIAEAALGSGSQEIQVRHDSLRHLQITRCRVIRISVRCPQLETLSLKRSGMASAMLTCPQLRKLDVASCHKLSDAGVRVAATSCPLLTSLDMSNCSYVSDETLREISAACSNLRVLDASYCPNISLEAVRMPMLMDMKLHSCEGINASSMAALSHCFMLEALQLDFCWLLTSVTLELPRLQNISLVNCRKFVELNLRCPVLSLINVSSCPILNHIDITSSALQKLVLQKQQSLTTMALQCFRLREVDLTECESLTNSICKVFSVGGGCPMLSSLILDSCESLTAIQLNTTSLLMLSLVGCRAMTKLELACPNLQQVYLDGCDHLEEASFCPVGLQSLNLGICPRLNKLEMEAPQMTVLELKGCGVLSQAAINCPRLLSLDASFCSQLKDDCLIATTASCPLIESLILMSCPSIGTEGLFALRLLSNLTLLDLSYTFLTNLQPVFETCHRLKVLKLQACKYLMDTSLDALHRREALPELVELDLSYGSLCQSAIEELLVWCPHLTHVSLNGCANMHDLDWGLEGSNPYKDAGMGDDFTIQKGNPEACILEDDCDQMDDSMNDQRNPDRSLQNLNCVGCPNIKKVAIPASALCLHLSSLNLSLSANIREVDLACLNLTSLNLSNCVALEMLKLDCPRLTSLLLQSCGIEEQEVEFAIRSCNLLETLDVRFCPKISLTGITRLRVISPGLKRLFSSVSV